MDDDVFINRHLLTQFIAIRDPHELALYGPGYCDWGVKRELKEKISMTLNMQMPDFIHIVIGGIMLFTAAAVKRFTDSTLLMQCIRWGSMCPRSSIPSSNQSEANTKT